MPLPTYTDSGIGPVVVLLHGVGVGPGSFAEVAASLHHDHRVIVVERPGGDDGVPSLEAQADAIVDLLGHLSISDARIVGVSGGATLGLVIGIRHPGAIGGLVVHEPLVGRHAPSLHRRFTRAAALAESGPDGAIEVVRSVMGEHTWSALDPADQQAVIAHAPRWRHEIARFAGFDPTLDELAILRRVPMLITVGSHSTPDRYEAADVLRSITDAEVASVAGAGNAAQLDAPQAFAEAVRGRRPAAIGGHP